MILYLNTISRYDITIRYHVTISQCGTSTTTTCTATTCTATTCTATTRTATATTTAMTKATQKHKIFSSYKGYTYTYIQRSPADCTVDKMTGIQSIISSSNLASASCESANGSAPKIVS